MPDIFTYFGFIFSFYSNEHEPIHVHVEHKNKMSIYDIIVCNGELIEIRQRDKGNHEVLLPARKIVAVYNAAGKINQEQVREIHRPQAEEL